MIEYLNNFDYLKEKYLIDDKGLLLKLAAYEQNEQQCKLQKMPASYIGKTVNSVYGFSYTSKMQTMMSFGIVWKSIINNFLNIKGLELLFNEHYYDFEWDMHLEIDFEKSEPTYYRDHMEHQIRNMYMMQVLLEKFGFSEVIKSLFSDKSSSKVSDYFLSRFNEFVKKQHFDDKKRSLLIECSKCYHKQLIKDFISKNAQYKEAIASKNNHRIIQVLLNFFEEKHFLGFSPEAKEHFFDFFKVIMDVNGKYSFKNPVSLEESTFYDWIDTESDEVLYLSYFKTYSISYIIRSAAMISALFHDISYPLCFFMNMQRRVGQYLPSMNAFTHNIEADIDRIVSVLEPSLLFVLVSESEIRSKLAKSQKKYDHGVFSAIALLLSFYESGRIHQLPIDKQLALELAALAIYNHNFSYYINDSDSTEYYRPVFTHDPISFILKICDDMQEWDRRYFELSERESFVFCPQCLSPIIKQKIYINNELNEKMVCRCKETMYHNSKFFSSRNMYTVTTCHSVDMFSVKQYEIQNLVCRLNYSLLDLLHMSQISCSYATYRAKELKKLKEILLNQCYYINKNDEGRFENIYLDYIMSSNPIFLKSKMLQMYILKKINLCISEDTDKEIMKHLDGIEELYFKFLDDIKKRTFTENHSFGSTNKDSFAVFTEEVKKKFKSFLSKDSSKTQKACSFWLYQLLYGDVITDNAQLLYEAYESVYNSFFSGTRASIVTSDSSEWKEFCEDLKNIIDDSCIAVIINSMSEHLNEIKKNKNGCREFQEMMANKVGVYLNIAGYFMKLLVGHTTPSKNEFKKQIKDSRFSLCKSGDKHFISVLDDLLDDVYSILSNQQNVYEPAKIKIEKYKKQFIPDKKVVCSIEQYRNPLNWYGSECKNYNKFAEQNLDFYSDLILFEIIGKEIEKE